MLESADAGTHGRPPPTFPPHPVLVDPERQLDLEALQVRDPTRQLSIPGEKPRAPHKSRPMCTSTFNQLLSEVFSQGPADPSPLWAQMLSLSRSLELKTRTTY